MCIIKTPAAVPSCYASVADLPTVILEPDVAGLSYEGEHTLLPVECKVGRDTCLYRVLPRVAVSIQVTDSTPVSSVTWIKVGQTSVYSTQPAITVVSSSHHHHHQS